MFIKRSQGEIRKVYEGGTPDDTWKEEKKDGKDVAKTETESENEKKEKSDADKKVR